MDEIIEFKDICRLIDKEKPDNAKILQATNEWFASFLEDFVAGADNILVRIHNNQDVKNELIALDKKIYRIHEKKKLIDWVMQAFARVVPEAKEKAQAIESIINTVMLDLKNENYSDAEQTFSYLPSKIKELNKKLSNILEDFKNAKMLVFACDKAEGATSFIEQRDKNQLDRIPEICDQIKHIIEIIRSGINPRAKVPKCFSSGLCAKKTGGGSRLIFYELKKNKSFVVCIYIDEKTHNDAVNKNVKNTYRKICDNELTKDNFSSYRRIDPDTLQDFE